MDRDEPEQNLKKKKFLHCSTAQMDFHVCMFMRFSAQNDVW